MSFSSIMSSDSICLVSRQCHILNFDGVGLAAGQQDVIVSSNVRAIHHKVYHSNKNENTCGARHLKITYIQKVNA